LAKDEFMKQILAPDPDGESKFNSLVYVMRLELLQVFHRKNILEKIGLANKSKDERMYSIASQTLNNTVKKLKDEAEDTSRL
jgi:hypothetical protein